MQYKIPVQIENEDPIFLGMSLRQLVILMIGCGIGYSIFQSLEPSVGIEIAIIPAVAVAGVALAIAKFRVSEMSFVKFVLSFVRTKVNIEERKWVQGVDSFHPIEVGFVGNQDEKKQEKVDFRTKIDKINSLEENISKI